ncbi:MAG TPA: cytochrome c3 family protein [Desulfobacteria bacterium]|nr:cytochrome c3 family protein [Desulfobacteria bacterium]
MMIAVSALVIILAFLIIQPELFRNRQIVILGYNDLGMHCIQPDYSQFLILPPGNNIIVQIFQKSSTSKLLTEGIKVKYKINSQDDPTKYTNFWVYADKYGYNVPKGVGITGNSLEGFMKLDPTKRYWEASAVPVTSKTGGTGTATPYQTATITILDQQSNKVLAEFDKLVVPVSPEMNCLNCHESWPGILKDHDEGEGTKLYNDSLNGDLHRCSECHPDPILDQPGKPGIPSLSLSMHSFHEDKMTTNIQPVCYNCHPGLITDCNRGVMRANNIRCEDCHGNMKQVADTIKSGRTPWLQELGCEKCHKQKYKVNPGQLYRRSYLLNGPDKEMNNKILCATCHNGPHAEWPSLLQLDNILPKTVQGEGTYIKKCTVCHINMSGTVHH